MPLDKFVIDAIQAEVDTLVGENEELDQQIEELKQRREANARKIAGAREWLPDPEPKGLVLTTLSMRDAIRSVLSHSEVPMMPADVRDVLENAGVESPGKTDFATRIGSDLYRMWKNSELTKGQKGYALAKSSDLSRLAAAIKSEGPVQGAL